MGPDNATCDRHGELVVQTELDTGGSTFKSIEPACVDQFTWFVKLAAQRMARDRRKSKKKRKGPGPPNFRNVYWQETDKYVYILTRTITMLGYVKYSLRVFEAELFDAPSVYLEGDDIASFADQMAILRKRMCDFKA